MLYLLLKWVHILLAMVAVGANFTYGIWLNLATRNPGMLPFTLRTIKILDDRVANPAYVLLLVTGLAMVFVGQIPLTTPWILASLILYAALVLVGLLAYTPALRRQIQLLENLGPASEGYLAIARRGRNLGIILALLAVAIIFLMVTKPQLWM